MHTRQTVLFAAFMLCLAPIAAGAVPAANGPAFKVSSCDTCKKRTPVVAGATTGATAGAFQVAWESTTPADPLGISARFFSKAGAPRSSDIQVNKINLPQQHDPAIAADAAGNSIVAWSEASGLNSDVMVQRYKASGVLNGAPILVNVDTPGAPVPALDFEPAVAMAADDSFVVAWIRSVPPGADSPAEDPAVWVRRFTNTGLPVGPPVKLSAGLVRSSRPHMCIDTTGRAVVAWTTVDSNQPFQPNKKGVSVRRVSTAGAPVGAELVVAPPLASDSSAAVGCGAGGTFVVVWSTDQAPAVDDLDIVGQRFTTLARRNGPAFRINATTLGEQALPALAMDVTGNFVVVWQSRLLIGNTGDSILGRRFLASATADGTDFVVYKRLTEIEQRPQTPDVASLGAAGFVIVWSQGSSGLQAQRYKLTP